MPKSADDDVQPGDSAQRLVLDAVASRRIADLLELPEAERCLPAAFLQRLIDGSHDGLGGPVRIRGATVAGRLRPPLGVPAGSCAALLFRECRFDSPVDLSGARFLTLRFVDDLRLYEIAEVLQIPLGTVKSRLHLAIRQLRESMPKGTERDS